MGMFDYINGLRKIRSRLKDDKRMYYQKFEEVDTDEESMD